MRVRQRTSGIEGPPHTHMIKIGLPVTGPRLVPRRAPRFETIIRTCMVQLHQRLWMPCLQIANHIPPPPVFIGERTTPKRVRLELHRESIPMAQREGRALGLNLTGNFRTRNCCHLVSNPQRLNHRVKIKDRFMLRRNQHLSPLCHETCHPFRGGQN